MRILVSSIVVVSLNKMHCLKTTEQQECIPVGCVPSAAVAARGCLPGRDVWPGGCLPMGVSASVYTDAGIHTPLPGRHSPGVWPGGMCIPACTEAHPPVDRILDTRLWKHYLSATTLRTVIKSTGHEFIRLHARGRFHSQIRIPILIIFPTPFLCWEVGTGIWMWFHALWKVLHNRLHCNHLVLQLIRIVSVTGWKLDRMGDRRFCPLFIGTMLNNNGLKTLHARQ